MRSYVALLRGIAPTNPKMRNNRLREVFEDLGFSNVRTVISSGNVLFETDSSAVRALEMGAEVFLKATKVDGVYDKDPQTNCGAIKFDDISYEEVLRLHLKVIDSTAVALCMDHQLPIIVFNIGDKGSMRRIAQGERVGTLIGRMS